MLPSKSSQMYHQNTFCVGHDFSEMETVFNKTPIKCTGHYLTICRHNKTLLFLEILIRIFCYCLKFLPSQNQYRVLHKTRLINFRPLCNAETEVPNLGHGVTPISGPLSTRAKMLTFNALFWSLKTRKNPILWSIVTFVGNKDRTQIISRSREPSLEHYMFKIQWTHFQNPSKISI